MCSKDKKMRVNQTGAAAHAASLARAEFQEGVYREMEHSMVNKRAETELALFTCVQHVRAVACPACML